MMTKGRELKSVDEKTTQQWLDMIQGTDFFEQQLQQARQRSGEAGVMLTAKGTEVADYQAAIFLAVELAEARMVPKAFELKDSGGKANIPALALAMLAGRRVGLDALASVQSIMVVNGIPSLWGKAPLAVCQSSPVFDGQQLEEWWEVDGVRSDRPDFAKDSTTACAKVCRKGEQPHISRFSVADAKRAGLWGASGKLYGTYPQRMLKHRALGFALVDRFPDVLMGLGIQGVDTVEQDDEDDQEPQARQSVLDRVAATGPREMGPKEPLPELKLDEAAFTREAQPAALAVPVAPETQVANVATPAALADLVNEVLPAKPAEVAPQAATTGEPDLWTLKADKIVTLRKLGGNWNVRPEALERILVEGVTRPGCYDENELMAAIKAEMKVAIPPGGSAASRGNV